MNTTRRSAAESPFVTFNKPAARDGQKVWKLVKDSGVLDVNSAYSYIMLCDYFADTCLVARADNGELAGFVTAYIPTKRKDTLFVWQIAVSRSYRGYGLGLNMLLEVLEREACREVRYLEATISPSNQASRALFRRLSDQLATKIRVSEGYTAELFPTEGSHEDEELFRIGPFNVTAQ